MTTTPLPSLRQIATNLRAGTLSARDIAEACTEAWQATEPELGAYKTWAETLPNQADFADRLLVNGRDLGALHGIPVSVKDLYGVPGLPTFAGSPEPLPDAWTQAGPMVQRVMRQMGLITGKTHSVEFAYGGLGTNPHWTPPRNPWDRSEVRVPGGSSSGAGVSIIQGSALIALGTDTAGSVRVPASMTGTVGLKTTKGLWSTDGIVPLSTSLDTPGLLTRTAEDAAYAFEALQQQSVPVLDSLKGVRLGVPEQFFWDGCEPGISETVQAALNALEQAGATLVPLELPGADEAFGFFQNGGGLTPPELYAFLKTSLPAWLDTLDPTVRQRIEAGKDLPAWEYAHRIQRLKTLGAEATAALSTVDALITPSVAITPPTLDELKPEGAYPKANIKALRNTCIGNLLGLCGLSMPVGKDAKNMPVGMLFTAAPFTERRVLSVAMACERALL